MEFKFASKESSLRFVEFKFLWKESSLRFVEFTFAFGGIKIAFGEFKFLSKESSFCKRLWAPSYTVSHHILENDLAKTGIPKQRNGGHFCVSKHSSIFRQICPIFSVNQYVRWSSEWKSSISVTTLISISVPYPSYRMVILQKRTINSRWQRRQVVQIY